MWSYYDGLGLVCGHSVMVSMYWMVLCVATVIVSIIGCYCTWSYCGGLMYQMVLCMVLL